MTLRVLALAVVVSVACTPSKSTPPPVKPADAWGAVGDPLPEGATLYTGTLDDWEKLKDAGEWIPDTDAQRQAAQAAADARAQAATVTLQSWFQLHPAQQAAIEALYAPPPLDTDYAQRVQLTKSGGTYVHHLQFGDAGVVPVVTQTEEFTRQTVARSLEAYLPQNALRTHQGVYSALYARVKRDPRFSTSLGRFKTPAQVDAMTNDQDAILALQDLNLVVTVPVTLIPTDPRPAPEAEEGYLDGSDRTASGCHTPAATGINHNLNYPLKYFTTSVKEQGARGTCVAFAINAALETALARDEGKYVNLSEQDLYFHATGEWFPAPYAYADGLSDFDTAKRLKSWYGVPLEKWAPYNPSWQRVGDPEECNDAGQPACQYKYTHSCDGYANHCSNTNHQGWWQCVPKDTWTLCGFTPPFAGPSRIVPTAVTQLWNFDDVEGSISLGLIALTLGTPLIVGVATTASFDVNNEGFDGYLLDSPDNDPKNYGGHALEIVGYIDDTQLPAGAPKAGNYGGGGYFIVKNSWGTCYGDQGYVYIPYGWLKRRADSMVAIAGFQSY
jgi:hypothetical protein